MDENEIKKRNIKLSVFDTFDYCELKKVCDAIVELGYKAEIVSNGNIVFMKRGENDAH